jgi:hypothetical protein
VKLMVDENLPPALANALAALFEGTHQVHHIRTYFGPGVKDVEWITKLSRDGRWAVISGDRRITRVRAEYSAFRSSRLVGFFLSKGLYKAPLVKQMERILVLWPLIEQSMSIVEGGAMFELQMSSNRLSQIKL